MFFDYTYYQKEFQYNDQIHNDPLLFQVEPDSNITLLGGSYERQSMNKLMTKATKPSHYISIKIL